MQSPSLTDHAQHQQPNVEPEKSRIHIEENSKNDNRIEGSNEKDM